MKIPEGYQTVMPYLIVNGASNFVAFMKNVFNAVENEKMRFMRDEKTIMHGEISIGDSTIMFADSTATHKSRGSGLFIYVDNADATYQRALEDGATVITVLSDQEYGRTGGVSDPFGNEWWITSMK